METEAEDSPARFLWVSKKRAHVQGSLKDTRVMFLGDGSESFQKTIRPPLGPGPHTGQVKSLQTISNEVAAGILSFLLITSSWGEL